MYKVIIDGITAHNPALDDQNRLVYGGVVKKSINCADSFTFTIYPENQAADSIHKMVSEVTVLQDGSQIFHGRVVAEQTGMQNERLVTCEGDLAIFNDTIMPPYDFTGSVADYLQLLVDNHNSQTTADKMFQIRTVTVEDPNDNIVRSNQDYSVTMAELLGKLPASALGGYIMTEYVGGIHYLDYLEDSTDSTTQKVTLSKNLLDFARISNGAGIITALIPLGAKDEETGQRLTIESVNDGKNYIVDEDAAEEYGLIYGTQVWDDVTVPANLLQKAEDRLTDLSAIIDTITIKAVDLSLTDSEIEALGFFQYVTLQDPAHRASGQYLITSRQYSLSNPAADTITFGGTLPTISSQAAKSLKYGEQIRQETSDMIEYMTGVLTGSRGGYKVELMNEEGLPEQTLYMDTPDMATARKVLRINKDGIGFSQSGVAGPYRTAWTIDGKFAADYIQTGMLRSRNGLFSLNMDSGEVIMRNGFFSGSIYSQDATITGGTINIEGSAGYSMIRLYYGETLALRMTPRQVQMSSTENGHTTYYQARGVDIVDTATGNLRMTLTPEYGLTFYNAAGQVTKAYPAT